MNRVDDKRLPRVTCIVTNYNGKHLLSWSLPSILKTDYPDLEFILVDDGSSDGSLEFVKDSFPSVNIIKNDRNLGFAESCNKGIRAATGKYIALLNNDVVVTPFWLKELVNFCEAHPDVVACAPKILALLNKSDEFVPSSIVYNLSSAQDILGYAFSEAEGEIDRGQYRNREVLSTCGICLLRADVVKEFGGFDGNYFFGIEDIDLCWRFRLAGYKVYRISSSVVYHRWRTKKTLSSYQAWYLEERNRLTTLLKNYSLSSLVKYLVSYFFVKFAEIGLLTFLRHRLAFYVAKAMFWNLVNFPLTYRKRLLVQRTRTIPDREIIKFMYRGSVEFRRFIQGRTKEFLTSFF